MNRLRKWRKPALALLALLILAQLFVSLMARIPVVHSYFERHLEASFGRSVEVRRFGALLFPTPVLEAEQVTVGEDPAFGNEYFLRAEHLSANLRWSGLLRGRLEFGTVSLNRPSLILVHSAGGSWNLERWLPPFRKPGGSPPAFYGPQPITSASNRLHKIDIEDGRISFKSGNDKLPFAFTGVSGSVEQVAPGRWRLDLQAQPWRSGVVLQSVGTAYVRGDVAGTSARLQPAEIHVHWDEVSLADLFRLIRGQDYGVRGMFALDAVARSGGFPQGAAEYLGPGEWSYSLQARATEIHRWDLAERRDNPGINVSAEGHWNAVTRSASAERLVVETSRSNLRGNAHISAHGIPLWEVHVDSAGIQASDLLAWCRAFYPDIDEKVAAEQFFTGALTVRGWPLEVQDAAFSSRGGELHIPGLNVPLRVSGFSGGRQRSRLVAGPIRISYSELSNVGSRTRDAAVSKTRSAVENRGAVEITFAHDFVRHSGSLTLDGRVERAEDALTFTAALGRRLNRGWELSGPASVALHRDWDTLALGKAWNGRIDVTGAKLQVAGLNRPLQIGKARMEWSNGARTVQIAQVNAFGTQWFGLLAQPAALDPDAVAKWNFRLHADRIDAADLDRWIGPRARPGWLRRLLPSVLGRLASPDSIPNAASELLRRVDADGELRFDEFTVEKIKLTQIRADVSIRDLHVDVLNSDAQWASGKVSAKVRTTFSARPAYDIVARFDRVNVSQLPAAESLPEKFNGQASGSVHLTTEGLGRDELLQNLAGKGEVRLRNVEFDGWDVSASVADGQPRAGASRWPDGEGAFTIRERNIQIPGLRLDAGPEVTLVKGSVNFGRETDLTVQIAGASGLDGRVPEGRHVLKISGPLELPHVSIETLIAREPAD
jgi:hypothetical protein